MTTTGRDAASIVAGCSLWDGEWYEARYPDVAHSGLSAVQHFLRFGAALRRDPGPKFSTRAYFEIHPEVARAGKNPLLHYLQSGASLESVRTLKPSSSQQAYRRALKELGSHWPMSANSVEGKTVCRQKCYDILKRFTSEFSSHKAGVLMPLGKLDSNALKSIGTILEQKHKKFELLVLPVQGGETPKKLRNLLPKDTRLRVVDQSSACASSALALGASQVDGTFVFHMQAGDLWSQDFLQLMLLALELPKTNCVQATMHLTARTGVGPVQELPPQDWIAQSREPRSTLSGFGYRRTLNATLGGIEVALAPLAEWDLQLRYASAPGWRSCPFTSVERAPSSVSQRHTALAKLICHRVWREQSVGDAAETLGLNIAIKTHASFSGRKYWGEFHFAEAMKASLEKLGHKVRIDFNGSWSTSPPGRDDLVIVLRGRENYTPRAGEFSILWVITHPDQVSYEEYAHYDLVFVASHTYAPLLELITNRPVKPLLQCTDPGRFNLSPTARGQQLPIFVGNSRGEFRDVVKWSMRNFVDIDIYGQGWSSWIPTHMRRGENIPNSELAHAYLSAQFVLTDHWESMRDFGMVANRVFDVLGCGGNLVSDSFPELRDLFGEAIPSFRDEDSFRRLMRNEFPQIQGDQREQIASHVHTHHSFDCRMQEVLRCFWGHLQNTPSPPLSVPSLNMNHKPRVGILPARDAVGQPDAIGYVRLVSPLTTGAAQSKFLPVMLQSSTDATIKTCDFLITQTSAITDLAAANELICRGTPFFLDRGDNQLATPASIDPTLETALLDNAREIMCSSIADAENLSASMHRSQYVANALDPRIWRNYLNPRSLTFAKGPRQLLCWLPPGAGAKEYEPLHEALETLAAEGAPRFQLTLVGDIETSPAPWLRVLPPPTLAGYPHVARWFLAQTRFEVGLALPMSGREQNDLRALEYAALGLASILPDVPAHRPFLEEHLALSAAGGWGRALLPILEKPWQFEDMRIRAMVALWRHRNVLDQSDGTLQLILDRWEAGV